MMACASAAVPPKMSNGVDRNNSISYPSTINRSLSTPDLIAALSRLSKGSVTTTVVQEEEQYVTNLDTELLSSQRHSSLNSSAENEVSLSLERTNSHSSRNNELTVPNGSINHPSEVQTSNGSLVSFSNVQMMHENEHSLECDRRISLTSIHSDSKRNLLSLQNVGRTLQRTHNHLKRTRLLHLFYFLALPVYTIIGALIFQALDGQHDLEMLERFQQRCIEDRKEKLILMEEICKASGGDCFQRFKEMLSTVDNCYREWQANNHTTTHPMSEFKNAVVYAFSVYTSIGYGTVSASTFSARITTIFYAAFGIPLFFAFVKEEGNQCRIWFVRIYNYLKRCQKRNMQRCCWKDTQNGKRFASRDETESLTMRPSLLEAGNFRPPFFPTQSSAAAHDPLWINGSDQRRVFLASVILFIIYLMLCSYIYSIMAGWDYFVSFYFTFSSVALIGFGDVYPKNANVIVANMIFIVIGVVLFSMCYFILQEEIRVKAFEASRKARMSISKYSHSLMLHTKTPWSRRNSPAFDQNEAASSNNSSKRFFERNRKRRQSAPAIHVQKMDC